MKKRATGLPAASVEPVQVGGQPGWRLRSSVGQALVMEHGAHLASYGHYGEPEVIWSNADVARDESYPARGGIPVCWPWFGALDANPAPVGEHYRGVGPAPFHGLARLERWAVEDTGVYDETAHLRLTMSTSPSTTPLWPHSARLSLTVEVNDALYIVLDVTNQDTHTLNITQSLHTYFAVSDVRRVHLRGFSGTRYDDALKGWARTQQVEEPAITGEIARHYQGLPPHLSLVDVGWKRHLELKTIGSRSAVLWNPGPERALRLDQFAPQAWLSMLCIEVGNLRDDALHLEPGATHQMGFRVRHHCLE